MITPTGAELHQPQYPLGPVNHYSCAELLKPQRLTAAVVRGIEAYFIFYISKPERVFYYICLAN